MEDRFTNTPEDAARFEARRGQAEHVDDRPTRAELERDEAECDCYPGGWTPAMYEGPQEHCPVHGRGAS